MPDAIQSAAIYSVLALLGVLMAIAVSGTWQTANPDAGNWALVSIVAFSGVAAMVWAGRGR